MNVAYNWCNGEPVTIKSVLVKCDMDWFTLKFADDNTGYGIWYHTCDSRWYIDVNPGDGYDLWTDRDAETLYGVYGDSEEEWVHIVNEFLADYDLKLGRFDKVKGDRYELIEL